MSSKDEVGALVYDPAIRSAIEVLLTEHSWMIDHHQSQRLAELYTENGRMSGIGPERNGRAAIEAYGRDRAAMKNRHARHITSMPRLLNDGPGRVRSLATITLYRYDGDVMGTADAVAVADAEDVFVLCDDGKWRFESRHLTLRFESEAHKH